MARTYVPKVNGHVTYFDGSTPTRARAATITAVGSTNGGVILRIGRGKQLICTTNGTTTLTATTGTFSSGGVGLTVVGAGIPPNTTISSFTDSTHVVMSNAATASASNVFVNVVSFAGDATTGILREPFNHSATKANTWQPY